jgi:hypothetical protein
MSTFTSEPGTRLGGRYRLEDRIAAASGWAAWKAIDEILARAVTVFTFAPGFPRIREVVTAARAASRLTDARLTQVFDVEDDWDNAYIVMEWATGDTVDDLLSSGPLEPSRGARIVAEAAAALSVAHAAGLAHLCLTPESLRWTPGGGVKVIGLGIDAALSGVDADDPELADTRGLGRVLYAALTGHWPGPDFPGLPPAPMTDGHPRSPRQVRAGVPTSLDDITCQALQLRDRGAGSWMTNPGQLATALTAVIPPAPLPPVSPPSRADTSRQAPQLATHADYWADQRSAPSRARPRRQQPHRRDGTSKLRTAVVAVLVVLAMAGVVAATSPLWDGHAAPQAAAKTHQTGPHGVSAVSVLEPLSASGFDETSSNAGLAIDKNPSSAWSTQWYEGNPVFGGLKKGSGLILDMGKAVTLSSVQVQFGSIPGADVQIMLGNSGSPQTQATLNGFTTVATASDVGGTHTFPVTSTASGRYVLIWFTKLPPMSGGSAGKIASQVRYRADIFNIIVRGTVVRGSA